MLIAIAGQVGTGKTTIASETSRCFGITLVSINQFKIKLGHNDPRFQYFWDNNIPLPDELRAKVFQEASLHLKLLAKENKHIIVDETFHKKAFREPFLEENSKLFNGLVLTLVITDEGLVKARLEKRTKEGKHIVGYGMHLAFKDIYESFDTVDYIYNNNGRLTETLPKFYAFLRLKLDQ